MEWRTPALTHVSWLTARARAAPLTCPLPIPCVQKETVGDLTILNAQLRHGGKYTCMAQTVVDSASKEATVLVRGDGVSLSRPHPNSRKGQLGCSDRSLTPLLSLRAAGKCF